MVLTLKLGAKSEQKSSPPAAPQVYRAAHVPGKPDNVWEVRDSDGLLVQEVVGADFETARRRCTWLAGKLNEAYAAGKRSGRG